SSSLSSENEHLSPIATTTTNNNEGAPPHSPPPKKRKFPEPDENHIITLDTGNDDHIIMELDNEDAICRRTRARYSLANFSLDELETFLQGTDDDEECNVDDEQEYRKFLAAVLLGGGESEDQCVEENGNVDDEDEDNDADFEVEIEEALDNSDLDENLERKKRGGRPQTRQNRKFLGQGNRPLRPLIPLVPYPALTWKYSLPESSPKAGGTLSGFTPHQIGQLHCLIHEHTQLLVQVFSLSVLDPSRQEIAVETRRLLSELVHSRDKVLLSQRKVPYPDYCFRPPYIQPSASDQLPFPVGETSSPGPQKEVRPMSKDCQWVPRVTGQVLSILDAAPLSLVGSYIADVSKAVKENQLCYVEALGGDRYAKEPLFPVCDIPPSREANGKSLRGATSHKPSAVSSSSNPNQPPKKTLAATLVEKTKKQSIAPAPKRIVSLAQRFYPLFNPALYPHKPPPPSVANRVLFTDTEDELLAMGMMEYNTDWKAIQQRYLPCKSKHQAVRQMKTSPLTSEEKARIYEGLKRFKLDWMSVWQFIVPYRDPSLLPRQWRVALGTQKSYKSDEAKKEKRRLYALQKKMSKSAAMASWHAASQKEDNLVNYSVEEDNLVNNSAEEDNLVNNSAEEENPVNNSSEEEKSGNDNVDDEDEAYVHEAFLGDWRPANARVDSDKFTPTSNDRSDLRPGILQPRDRVYVSGLPAGCLSGELPHLDGYTREYLSSKFPQYFQKISHLTHITYNTSYAVASNHFSPHFLSQSSKSLASLRPRRVRKRNDARPVKLAPDLPPVNLPPSVRVLSQSAFKSYHCVSSHSTVITSSGTDAENLVRRSPHLAKTGRRVSVNDVNKTTPSHHSIITQCPQDPGGRSDQPVREESGTESDLQMHPLLLQAPEDGHLAYCPIVSSTSNIFNSTAGNQLQENFKQFCKPSRASSTVDSFYKLLSSDKSKKSSGIDFHPLLQRKDAVYKDSSIVSADYTPVNLEPFRQNLDQPQNSPQSVMTAPHATSYPQAFVAKPTSPYEKSSELDLEIHLSSTSRKEKVAQGRKVTEHNHNASKHCFRDGGSLTEAHKVNNLSKERCESCSTASIARSSSSQLRVLGDHELVPPNNRSGDTEGNVGDQSLPEIVMEQEELSDSEDEIGEDVEFECEEIDDSDKEEYDTEQLVTTKRSSKTAVKFDHHCNSPGASTILNRVKVMVLPLGNPGSRWKNTQIGADRHIRVYPTRGIAQLAREDSASNKAADLICFGSNPYSHRQDGTLGKIEYGLLERWNINE
ncbi:hypothetical protein IFM89_030416, partial [Coptis chinensis]